MKRITHLVCPLCKGDTLKPRFSCIDHFSTGESFMVYECAHCGFVFTQDAPDEASIAPYYNSPSYISHSNTHKGIVNKLYHLVRRFMLRRKANLVVHLSGLQKGRLLDYGAGTGSFARLMQQRGWAVSAVEKSEQARFFSLENYHFRMSPPEAMEGFAAGSFDVITLWHVMEHLHSLDAFWEKLYELLDDKGVALIATPNSASFDAAHYGSFWAAYDVPRHLWHFTPSSLMRLGREHGFILERQYPLPFDGFYISMLSERYKGSKLPFVKGFFVGLAGWLATCGQRSAGSSIIYVFRKRK